MTRRSGKCRPTAWSARCVFGPTGRTRPARSCLGGGAQWASRQDLDGHDAAPWLAEALGRVGELLTGAPGIQVLTPLGHGTDDKATLR